MRQEYIRINLTKEEKEEIMKAAEKELLSISAFGRKELLKTARREQTNG